MNAVVTSEKQWVIRPRNLEIEESLCHEFSISRLVAATLVSRNLVDPQEVEAFLNPSLDRLHDPKLLPDFSIAAKCILEAREKQELIFIHGDYDVDGVTSTALFTRFLRNIGCKVEPHVPHRIKEGYGIHLDAVRRARDLGTKLFLTCDCGVKAHEQIEAARELGMKVVVTDHHEVGHDLPNAHALVNPHRPDSLYPFKELCGAGIVFKLCEGITRELDIDVSKFYRAYLDLATIGTIADVVPLYDENRIIVKHGLERLVCTQKEGLKALLEISSPKPTEALKAWHVGFKIGPRLNAVGRLDESMIALELLLENDTQRSMMLAQHLDTVNQLRRKEQQQAFEEAVEKVLTNGWDKQYVIVVSDPKWHPGIIGLVANKLAETFYRPSFVISEDPEKGIGKGSARTIRGFHLANSIHEHQHLFLACGGHEMAAGFSIALEYIDEMRETLNAYASHILRPEHLHPSLHIDAEVSMEEADYAATKELTLLEPFGASHAEPLFLTRDLEMLNIQPTSNPDHCRILLRNAKGETRFAMAFGLGASLGIENIGKRADVVFSTTIDSYNGQSSLKWFIKDFCWVS